MTKKWSFMLFLVLAFVLMVSPAAFAFSDTQGDPAEAKIEALSKAGIINGVDHDKFAPLDKVTFGQGIHLIVKGLSLNIDNLRFIKAPEASDYFDNVPNDAWYAGSMIIAHHNGLSLNRNVAPESPMTREQFANFLHQAINTKGTFPVNKMWIIIKDEADFSEGSINAVQDLIKMKVVQLEDGSFRPKAEITRSEAAEMLYNAIEFVKSHGLTDDGSGQNPSDQDENDVTMTSVSISPEVNKVVLSRGSKPNNGYGITITGIDFTADHEAVIRYQVTNPKPGFMYAQIITEPKAETYIAAGYNVILKQE